MLVGILPKVVRQVAYYLNTVLLFLFVVCLGKLDLVGSNPIFGYDVYIYF